MRARVPGQVFSPGLSANWVLSVATARLLSGQPWPPPGGPGAGAGLVRGQGGTGASPGAGRVLCLTRRSFPSRSPPTLCAPAVLRCLSVCLFVIPSVSWPRQRVLMALELLRCGAVLAAPAGAALACCLVAAAVALRCWAARGLRRALNKTSRQQEVVENLGQAVRALRRLNQEVDVETVLALPLVQLAQKLKNKELSPEAVLYSYLGKAWEVTKETNCITNYLGDCKAQLQEVAQRHGEGGLLYGVPISIKECFLYKGQASTLGLRRNMDFLATEDSVVVRVLKKQGAIPFAHTNVPQSMFSYDCSNPIFGRTLNPLNTSKSPGGSSGGEGALIAGGGSILGLGTDIGGSIRFPAAFCGICGLKPTSNRISKRGLKNSVNGQLAFTTSVGPMARDVDSLALCLRALLCDYMFCLDSTVPPVPFREEIYASKKPLRIGYYESDMFTMPSPSMKRAVLEMKVLLEAAGHTLVPFTPPNVPRVVQTLIACGLFSDGGQALLENFKGDSVDPCLGDLTIILKMPNWFKRLIAFFLRPLFPRLAVFLHSLKSRSAGELWDIQHKIEEYRYSVISQWKRQHLDVVLAPMLSPALAINYPGKTSGSVSYTVLYNCLDFPAGVVPVSTVTLEDELALEQYQGYFGDIWDQMLQKGLKNSVGMPVSVQCVALPWQDELCLRFMREVERVSQKAKTLNTKPFGVSEGQAAPS
uniref:Fatty-acid amide hydrolase 1 n=1 Tax=Monodelphis domestica TaxID=13616 RepID=A0A5F8GEX5_MONDO